MEQKPKNPLKQFARVGKVFAKQSVKASSFRVDSKPFEVHTNGLI